jgi:hypothetical protein
MDMASHHENGRVFLVLAEVGLKFAVLHLLYVPARVVGEFVMMSIRRICVIAVIV